MSIAKNVFDILCASGRLQSGELLQRLSVSRPSLMRAVGGLGVQIVTRGRARRTAYAARRSIRGNATPLALFRIDESGRSHDAGILEPTYPSGCAISFSAELPWPFDEDMTDGWFNGVPYPLRGMQPQGFLGRNFAHKFAAILQVDEDVRSWSEDDVLHALSILGSDQPGNYILGESALRRFLEEQQNGRYFLSDDEIEVAYPDLARQALNLEVSDSAVGGEFPKFTICRLVDGLPTHVIVKFSGARASPQEQRWSDLLICEHLALTTIADTLHLSASESRIFQYAGRTFYEVERFDRHGEFGRSGVCTWQELNSALFGVKGSWSEGAEALLAAGHISSETARQINILELFGRLIANTDMHSGNLAFLPGLTLTPAYDMLPMLYAPQRGVELAARSFSPALPTPKERGAWLLAAEAALIFWRRTELDERISIDFRSIGKDNADKIEHMLAAQRD